MQCQCLAKFILVPCTRKHRQVKIGPAGAKTCHLSIASQALRPLDHAALCFCRIFTILTITVIISIIIIILMIMNLNYNKI